MQSYYLRQKYDKILYIKGKLIHKKEVIFIMKDDMLLNKNINIYDISKVNLNNIFLHYINVNNLNSIMEKGLIPKIGINAKVIEKSKKIFFSVGDKGALVIMDSWIKWLIAKPKSNLIYWIGAYPLKLSFFPKIIHKTIISNNKKSKNKSIWSYRKLKNILDNSVYLILDLEENIDFSFDDVDEVKAFSNYPTSYIESLYAYDSDVSEKQMEYWNMHTFSNKVIDPKKISLLTYRSNYNASDIVKYLIEKNISFVKENCEHLYKYYNYIYVNNN